MLTQSTFADRVRWQIATGVVAACASVAVPCAGAAHAQPVLRETLGNTYSVLLIPSTTGMPKDPHLALVCSYQEGKRETELLFLAHAAGIERVPIPRSE